MEQIKPTKLDIALAIADVTSSVVLAIVVVICLYQGMTVFNSCTQPRIVNGKTFINKAPICNSGKYIYDYKEVN
jgi:hypothetical protein